MKILSMLVFLACFPIFSYANNITDNNNQFKPYVSLKGGYSNNNLQISSPASKDFYNNSFSFNPALGLKFDTRYMDIFSFRLEAEYFRNTSGSNNYTTQLQWRTGVTSYVYHYETRKSIINTTIDGMLFNAYSDIDLGINIDPYIVFGLGYGKIKQENQLIIDTFHDSTIVNSDSTEYVTYSENHSKYNMFWQIGVGLSFDITEKLSLNTEYRYINYGSLKLYDLEYKYYSNQFLVGAKYCF